MKRTVCPYCGWEMLDDDRSTRFRCQCCGEFFSGWKEELRGKLKEAIPTRMEEQEQLQIMKEWIIQSEVKDPEQRMEDGLELIAELVRCKDCKYSVDLGGIDVFGKPLLVCRAEGVFSYEKLKYPEGYCDEGKRRD